MRSPDECTCPCHANPKILHAAPCCYRCPSCKTPIRYALIDAHFEQCPESDVCTCACHETGALHARPCCSPCTVCNQDISIERLKSHDRRCPGSCRSWTML